jgi:arylsulfatase A-like enzyme
MPISSIKYALCIALSLALAMTSAPLTASAKTPNVVIIFIDDMGYADIGPFGATNVRTPNLDRMAKQGRKFTDFIVSSAVCSASRSALLTGCIHERIGFRGALGPQSKMGIAASEVTLGEICKQNGYATACFGKWHLGHHPKFLPTRHGFDVYYGLPYSNDMWPFHPEDIAARAKNPKKKPNYPPLPMIEGTRIVDEEVTGEDQTLMTVEYTQRAVKFIKEHAAGPFFVYMPHSMVHVPLYSSPMTAGKSGAGPYGDAVSEIDWSVGQVLDTLAELKLEEQTMVVFTTDNGPWLSYGSHGGSAGPLREGKGTSWEGGIRVPTLMQWKGTIPADSRCDQLASTIDLLPTVAAAIDAKLPSHTIDGKNIRSLMVSNDAKSPHSSIPCYYTDGQLQAIRNDRWKLVFPHTYRSLDNQKGKSDGTPIAYVNKKVESTELYDLDADVGETKNVADANPAVVQQLKSEADRWRAELGDSLTGVKGNSVRPADKLLDGEPTLTGQ